MRYFFFLTFPLYVIDQITKWWIVLNLDPPSARGVDGFHVIPGFFDIVRVHNTGVAFGQFNGGAYSNYIFGGISLLAMIGIIVLWRSGFFFGRIGKIAAALLISGILGNLTDRLIHGYVVDFLSFDLKFMVWPSFNVADACISIAAAILIIQSIFFEDPSKKLGKTSPA